MPNDAAPRVCLTCGQPASPHDYPHPVVLNQTKQPDHAGKPPITIIIEGHSDDAVEISGAIDDEQYIDGNDNWASLLISADGKDRVRVHASFGYHGWVLGISKVDEDVPIPSGWTFTLDQSPEENSARLTVVAPAGTHMVPST